MKTNFQLLCDEKIDEMTAGGKVPRLLLQSCCGPCSTYVLEYLTKFFDITLLFYNPNIFPEEEFEKRLSAQCEVIKKLKISRPVEIICNGYEHSEFEEKVKGLEEEREGGARCKVCFSLRLSETARLAKEMGFDCFATTLSVSPHKNAGLINAIGEELSASSGVPFLIADFKKREGYKRSVELSRELGIYRQQYCGCEFSK